MDLVESRSGSLPSALIYLFVFQNILNAGSPYLTLGLNLALATLALLMSDMSFRATDRRTFQIAVVIFVWLLLVIVYRGDFETQTLFKYVRTTLTIGLVTIFLGASRIEPRTFLNAICFTLGFHVLLVMLQIPFDNLVHITAPIFGFDRELSILDQYNLRKLGASSSYDTASFFSASAAVLFYLRYLSTKQSLFLLMLCVSLGAGMMSSRTGMAMTIAVLMFIYVKGIFTARPAVKLVLGLGMVGFLVFCYVTIYPLIEQTLGISELSADDATLIFSATDYGTTGTLDALSEDHLAPLKVSPLDLIIGFALDPNSIAKPSDIGYVKFIYHVGIVGTVMILFLHLRMMILTAVDLRHFASGLHVRNLGHFLLWLIGAGLLFNYKSLELYSRGTGDLIIILFIFLGTRRAWISHREGSAHA